MKVGDNPPGDNPPGENPPGENLPQGEYILLTFQCFFSPNFLYILHWKWVN